MSCLIKKKKNLSSAKKNKLFFVNTSPKFYLYIFYYASRVGEAVKFPPPKKETEVFK